MKQIKTIILLLLGPLIFALCCLLLPQTIFETFASRAAIGTVLWMAFWWVTAPIDYTITAFLPIVVNAIFQITEMELVIANYGSETILLLLGASIITVTWEETRLDKRIAAKFLGKVGSSFRKQLIFWYIVALSLSTVLPNAVVVATIIPIAVAMLKCVGEGDISKSKKGSKLLLYITYAAGVGGLASPLGGTMNLITVDYLQQLTGREYMYTSWVLKFLPVMIVLIVSNILFMLRDVKKLETIGGSKEFFLNEYNKLSRMSKEEKLSLALFVIATVLAFTRQLYEAYLPGLKPAYAFIICAVVSFFITKSDGERLLKWKTVQSKIVWGMMFIFAGGLAAGSLINHSGAARAIGIMFSNTEVKNEFLLVFVIITFTLLMSDFTSNTATAAVALPIVISIVQGLGEYPIPYVYITTIGVNLSYMFPTSIRAIPVGYGLSPKYMFQEGWRITLLVLVLMSVMGYFMLKYWIV